MVTDGIHPLPMTQQSSLTQAGLMDAAPVRVTIDRIRSVEALDAVKENWIAVYDQDPHGTVFTTWEWLRHNFDPTASALWVLAVRVSDRSDYVGFLPLKLRSVKRLGVVLERRLEMLGNYDADYTGFVCLPDYQDLAVSAFAEYVMRNRAWHSLSFQDVLDPRLDSFVATMATIAPALNPQIEQGNVSPFVVFPGDWETYLMKTVKGPYRRKIRNALKKLESDPTLQVVMATATDFPKQLAVFFKMHRSQWQIYTDANQVHYERFYRECFDQGLLRLAVLYQDATPIAADLLFYDAKQKSLGVYGRTYDPNFASLAPGHMNLCSVIRDCVAEGLIFFDFLRGDEGYKAIFGSEERWTRHVTILRSRRSVVLHKVQQELTAYRDRKRAQAASNPDVKSPEAKSTDAKPTDL